MRVFKAEGKRNFYKTFMELQSVRYRFNPREIAIGTEFLFYREYYLTSPIFKIDFTEEGEETKEEMTLIEQLKDIRTLNVITKHLDMSFTILRKHVRGLKEKGFFEEGEISKDFITDGVSVAFNLKKK